MLKSILGVLLGCAAMFAFFFAVFSGAYLGVGTERVFQPDSYQASTLWLVIFGSVNFFGGIVAGLVCAAVSRSRRTCQILAFVVFMVGILSCIPALRDSGGPNVRAGDVSNMEAMQLVKMPNWIHLLAPALGAAGVLVISARKFRAAL